MASAWVKVTRRGKRHLVALASRRPQRPTLGVLRADEQERVAFVGLRITELSAQCDHLATSASQIRTRDADRLVDVVRAEAPPPLMVQDVPRRMRLGRTKGYELRDAQRLEPSSGISRGHPAQARACLTDLWGRGRYDAECA
jgi:hypothetical protein